jgi:hypothetical protein
VTPGDIGSGPPIIIGGFDPSTVTPGQPIAITSGNATNALGNFAIPITKAFGTNGLKTIEIYTTDDAGARSNPVTLKFTLQATDIVPPPPTSPPAAPTLALPNVNKVNGVWVTKLTNPQFTGTTVIGTSITVTETWTDGPAGTTPITFTLPASAINTDGTFSFNFQDFIDPSTNQPVVNGTFSVVATASWINNPNNVGSTSSTPFSFQINNTVPAAVTDFRLSPADDTGIVGDNVTNHRTPTFIGTTAAGNTVELFVSGQPAIQATTTASANGSFSIQLPYALSNGQASVYVEVINPVGNISPASNSVGLALVSTAADYNGGPASDPALFTRNTSSNQLQWTVQPLSGGAPWFGPSGIAFSAGTANVVPFAGDFDGDGLTDLAYYNLSTATWTVYDSSNHAPPVASTFTMGTPNSSIPVAGNFDKNGPTEQGVFTINGQGQGVWSIAGASTGTRTFVFGQSGDIPLAGDFDAIGYDEPALYRPSTGQFLVLNPGTNTTETFSIPGISSSPDLSSLVPVPGQYDNQIYFNQAGATGQPIFGRTEAAVYDPKTGAYTILGPGGAVYTVSGFQPGDIPAPADYLGNGSDQVVVYRPSTGQFIEGSPGGTTTTLATLGGLGNVPITAPLIYRLPGGVIPTPSTPTPTPSTPTPTPSTPTPTPLVKVSNVQVVTNRKHKVTEVIVTYSGAVNAAEAQGLGEYSLVMAGNHGSFTAKNAKKIKLKAASYNTTNDTVTLIPRKAFALTKKVQLQVDGLPPSGLQDSQGRLIDGNHDGQPGGNAVAVLTRGGVSMAVLPVGPSGGANSVSAATIDALLELNALAGVTTPKRPGRHDQ